MLHEQGWEAQGCVSDKNTSNILNNLKFFFSSWSFQNKPHWMSIQILISLELAHFFIHTSKELSVIFLMWSFIIGRNSFLPIFFQYIFSCVHAQRVYIWLHKHMEKFEINLILIQCTPYCFFNIRKSDQFFVWYHCTDIVWHHLGMIIASMTGNAMFLLFPIWMWSVMCWSTYYLNPFQIDYFYNSSTELSLFAKAMHLAN